MLKAVLVLSVLGYACAEMPGVWLDDVSFVPRIIKGEDANEGEFPYMISLRRKSNNKHSCGGSVLTSNWVLTAAHCCDIGTKDSLQIYTGSIYLDRGGTIHPIENIIIHGNYSQHQQWRNDICLIRVSKPFTFSNNVKQITLPPQDWKVNGGDSLTTSGWGYTDPVPGQQVVPNRLQKATTFVNVPNEQCGSEVGAKMFPGYICARGGIKGQGVCNGDSGSPLVKNKVQVGITSWGILPCGSGRPDIFCRVPNYIDWIKQKLGSEASQLKFL